MTRNHHKSDRALSKGSVIVYIGELKCLPKRAHCDGYEVATGYIAQIKLIVFCYFNKNKFFDIKV